MYSNQLDYQKAPFIHPSYKYNKVLSITGVQTQTVSMTGSQENIFEIPVNVFNLSKSFLQFTAAPSASGAAPNFNYNFNDCFATIRQIQLYTRGGLYLADVNELANYTKVMWKADIPIKEYLTYDNFYNNTGGFGRYLRPSNSLVSSNTLTAAAPFAKRYDGSNANVNYLEPKYLEPGTGNTADPIFNILIPLDMIRNTIFAFDKSLYMGEIIILRIVWQASGKVCFFSTSATDPTAGGAAAFAGGIAITNLALYLAVETNQEIVNQLRTQVATNGFQVLIPYIYTYKTALNGASQTVSLRFNRGHGIRLKKIYHSVFNSTEQSATAYDCSNLPGAPKTVVFYTMLDNNRIQEYNLTCANDYIYLKDQFVGSVLQSSNVYYYNWVWIENWTGYIEKSHIAHNSDNLETGLDLNFERKWDFYGITMRNANYNHYSFVITQKMLTVAPAGITVI